MQLQIKKDGIINKFPVVDIESAVAPYLSFNNEYFLNLELSQEADGSNFKINGKYFKVIQNLDNVLHLTNSFYKMSNVYPDTYQTMTNVPDTLDTNEVTTTESMFYNCFYLTDVPLLDTSNVWNMYNMFFNCYKLITIPQLDISKVRYTDYMFAGCKSLVSIPQLDTSNVNRMMGMFQNCTSLTTIPKLSIDKATNISGLFSGCSSLSVIPKLDTSKIKYMSHMFDWCTSLPTEFPWIIDCSSIDKTEDIEYMFINSSVTKVRLSNVKQELRSSITSQLLKSDDTLEIIFVDAEEEPVNNDDWNLQFTLGTIESEVLLSNIPGFSDKDTPSLEDFYGEDYDNVGRHLEIRYLGTQGNLTYAPDGVAVPNGCSFDEEVAAALNPDGIADYDPDAGNITFSSGSAGTKVYMLVYHSEPFNS